VDGQPAGAAALLGSDRIVVSRGGDAVAAGAANDLVPKLEADRWAKETLVSPAPSVEVDCFWCGAVLFLSDDRLVCPDDGSVVDADSYCR
jgi:hypothetical protein